MDVTSGKAGPDLFAVGDKFGRREIIESILSPSASIADSYHTTVRKTKSGEEFSGVIKQIHHGRPGVTPELARPVSLRLLVPDALKFDHPVWLGTLPGCSDGFLVVEHQTKKSGALSRTRNRKATERLCSWTRVQ